MRTAAAAALVTLCLLVAVPARSQTAAGIPLDAPWKVTVFQLAHEKFVHPAWGWQHSARNYRLGLRLAEADGLPIDRDVLFAAAFLHDMAAYKPYEKTGIEHGDRAAQTSEAVLRAAGFPMAKFPAVQAAERGHMYYREPGSRPEAIVLHDADSLDFLGDVGAARMLALTGERASSFAPALRSLRSFVRDIPPHLKTRLGRRLGVQRAAELTRFLDGLEAETFGGAAR